MSQQVHLANLEPFKNETLVKEGFEKVTPIKMRGSADPEHLQWTYDNTLVKHFKEYRKCLGKTPGHKRLRDCMNKYPIRTQGPQPHVYGKAQRGGCCRGKEIGSGGFDTKARGKKGQTECQRACDDMKNCTHYSYDHGAGVCALCNECDIDRSNKLDKRSNLRYLSYSKGVPISEQYGPVTPNDSARATTKTAFDGRMKQLVKTKNYVDKRQVALDKAEHELEEGEITLNKEHANIRTRSNYIYLFYLTASVSSLYYLITGLD